MRKITIFTVFTIGCAAMLLCLASQAIAHRLNVYAWLENDRIIVECGFGDNRPAMKAEVTILDAADNKPLLSGQTNEQGRFVFAVPDVIRQGHGLIISVNSGQGHQGQWEMEASELYAAASLTAGFDQAALAERKQAEHAHVRALPVASAPMSALTLQQVRDAVAEQIAPLKQQIAAQSAKGPGLAEIIGGIGWIIGLVGIGLYFKSRRA